MKFLKGLALSILSLLLFLSLSLFGFAFMLNRTLLNPDFVAEEVDKLSVSQLVREVLPQMIPQDFQVSGSPIPISRDFVTEAVSSAVARYEPELKQQASAAINDGYDYFLGKTDKLSITISLEPIKADLKETLRQSLLEAFTKSPPAQLQALPPEMREQLITQYFDQFFEPFCQQLSTSIPDRFEIDEASLRPERVAQIHEVKKYIGYYQTGFKLLFLVMALLVLGIFLLEMNLKSSARSLGISLLFYGAAGFVFDFVIQRYVPLDAMLPRGVPESLAGWATGLLTDITAPLSIFSIATIVAGAILLVISFLLKSSPKPEALST